MSGHRLAAVARALVAPVCASALALAGVLWAFPAGLAFWRAGAIVAAWAGTGLLAASLVFMVRDPRLAAVLGGLDRMYRWHHRAGVAAYVLLLCHPLALAIGGWSESAQVAWQEIAPWEQGWPVQLGWVALVLLMAGLATTFTTLRSYRIWRALHYVLALGVVAGLGHTYAVLGDPGALLIMIAVAVVALAWRLAGSDAGALSHPYRVVAVARRAARMIEASLAPSATRLQVAPGQFVLAGFGDGAHFHGCKEFHPFTVSGIAQDGTLNVSIKALGPCTQHIQQLEPGVRVRLQGPFGDFLDSDAHAPQLWVAGGVGITPFIAAVRSGAVPAATTLIYLFRTEADAAFRDEFEAFARAHAGFRFLPEATGDSAPDLARLLAHAGSLAGRQVHACGPPPMVQALKARLLERGVPPAAIHFESFDFR